MPKFEFHYTELVKSGLDGGANTGMGPRTGMDDETGTRCDAGTGGDR
jgi:hypothetical protein